jgi:hypothetical protein
MTSENLTPDEAYALVERMADRLGQPVDSGIKPLVAALWLYGYQTRASCEGHTDRGHPYPWVDIHDPEARDMAFLWRELGRTGPAFSFQHIVHGDVYRLTFNTLEDAQRAADRLFDLHAERNRYVRAPDARFTRIGTP